MASTFDEQENEPASSSDDLQELSPNIAEDKLPTSESEETNHLAEKISETSMGNPANMVTAEASFTEATSADIPLGATRSSVARILVKPGQIFRVQVDNEVKEVHGKLID